MKTGTHRDKSMLFKRTAALVLAAVLTLGLMPQLGILDGLFQDNITAVSAEDTATGIYAKQKWEANYENYNVSYDENKNSISPNNATFWKDTRNSNDTETLQYYPLRGDGVNTVWVDPDKSGLKTYASTDEPSAASLDDEDTDTSLEVYSVEETEPETAVTESVNSLAETDLTAEDNVETAVTALGDTETTADEEIMPMAVDVDDEPSAVAEDDEEVQFSEPDGVGKCITNLVTDDTDTRSAYDVRNGSNATDELYYTVEYSESLNGYYRQYYISSGQQLYNLLSDYKNASQGNAESILSSDSNFNKKIGTYTDTYIDTNGEEKLVGDKCVAKIGIVLLCDIDLGGVKITTKNGTTSYADGTAWTEYSNTSVYLELDGQGHTIYNQKNKCFIGVGDSYLAIHDVTFSNYFKNSNAGMFGNGVKYAYFENVNWENCFAYTNNSSVTIVLGTNYTCCYFKNCTISNSCVVDTKESGTSDGHCGMFGSFNKSTASTDGYYITEIDDTLNDVENLWSKNKNYPTIYENCATVQCDVYQFNEEAMHSGIFVSCTQGNIIFRNCFANGSIYGAKQLGVFIGGVLGSGANGFEVTENGTTTRYNTIFENCYASGIVEGESQLGGFVGIVYNDHRATMDMELGMPSALYSYNTSGGGSKRGIVYFKNCYSTSSVGMDNSADIVGGFVGILRGNLVKSYNNTTKKIEYNELEKRYQKFENCYAAGEVGGITSNTSTDESNKETIGGFIGTYCPKDYDITLTEDYETNKENILATSGLQDNISNCYYDKQTTAMRERDIGNYTVYLFDSDSGINSKTDESYNLTGTLSGITGVYTKTSSDGKTKGLADLTAEEMGGGDVWDCSSSEYYPQLKAMSELTNGDDTLVGQMYTERRQLFIDYSYASTAAVMLDHYDTILDESGNETSDSDTTLIYDTVRDITSKFIFTTDTSHVNGSYGKWEVDTAKNGNDNFTSKFGKGDATGFSMTYQNGDKKESVNFDPYVLQLAKPDSLDNSDTVTAEPTTDEDHYRCIDFAPGKQWVKVTVGSGSRDLRLLPKAYLNAGGTIEVNAYKDTDGTLKNDVKMLANSANESDIPLNGFNHYVGVAYGISDRYRMGQKNSSGDTEVYNNQILSLYTENSNDTTSFMLYSGYTIDNATNTAVSEMQAQKFAIDDQTNDSTDGGTIIKVYKTKKINGKLVNGQTTYTLTEDVEIKASDTDKTGTKILDYFSGETNFNTISDSGMDPYYYMKYYWRLSDGRYLSDYKLVKIKSSSHSVQMVTGIINTEQEMYEENKEGYNTDIDQYVYDGDEYSAAKAKYVASNVTLYSGLSDDEKAKYSSENDYYGTEYYNGTDEYFYNSAKQYGNDTYYVKSEEIVTTQPNSVVGWRRTSEYYLTTLIVEAQDDKGNWNEMTRVDANSPTFDFSNAKYSYKFTSYSVTQSAETKEFTVTESSNSTKEFSVQSTGTASSTLENYIVFNFSEASDEMKYDSSDSIRVTALFRRNYADIQTEKNVLVNTPDPVKSVGNTKSTVTVTKYAGNDLTDYKEDHYDSLQEIQTDYEVDDSGITAASDRKAVLSGDTLTYRMRIYNAGYYNSDVVNVYDTVPDGCEYVKDSVKIYRQVKDISSTTGVYQQLVDVGGKLYKEVSSDTGISEDNTSEYIAQYDEQTGELHWQMPTVELDCDYYVEFKVKVKQISAATEKTILENNAIWDYVELNGDLDLEEKVLIDTNVSIEHYKQNAIFTMEASVDDETQYGKATYTISFAQNKKDSAKTYTDVYFENTVPAEFNLESDSIKLYNGENEISVTPTITTNSDGTVTFKISGFSFESSGDYKVEFTGDKLEPTEGNSVVNNAKITYWYDNKQMGNSINKTTSLTNEVETDAVHLYINVEKTISQADPAQTFLFKIERFDSAEDAQKAEAKPTDTFYTKVNCTEQATENIETESGDSAEETVYKGSSLVQIDKRGYYVVTEITDFSNTDYDYSSVETVDISTDSYPVTQLNGEMVNGGVVNAYGAVALPRLEYSSEAIPTALGIVANKAYPTVSFTDTNSVYAYRSSQAYADNTIESKTEE